MHQDIPKVEYFRQRAALLRAYARSMRGRASSKLIEVAEYLDSQVAIEAALAKSDGAIHPVSGLSASADVRWPYCPAVGVVPPSNVR
jgi:hypothetical protein